MGKALGVMPEMWSGREAEGVKTGRQRKLRRLENRPKSNLARILQHDLSSILFTSFDFFKPKSKHTKRKIRAGRMMSRNDGLSWMPPVYTGPGEFAQSGTSDNTSCQSDESGGSRVCQMSETASRIFYPS